MHGCGTGLRHQSCAELSWQTACMLGCRDGHSWSLEGEAQDDLSKLAELGLQLHALLTGEREAASEVWLSTALPSWSGLIGWLHTSTRRTNAAMWKRLISACTKTRSMAPKQRMQAAALLAPLPCRAGMAGPHVTY